MGRSLTSVADDPFALTLYTFWQVLDIERMERLEQEWTRLTEAHMTAIAFHEPKRLLLHDAKLRAKLGMVPSRAETMQKAAQLLAQAKTQPRAR